MKLLVTVLLSTIILSNYPTYDIGDQNPNLLNQNSNNKEDIIVLEKKVNDLTQEVYQLKTLLNQLVKQIDDLKANVSKSQKNNAGNKKNERPTRKAADPNYVHNIPQGNSYFKGNPDARVTITEFFDFQ